MKENTVKEATFKKRVLSRLRKLQKTVVFTIQQASIRGTPDLLVSINGRFVALELKRSATAAVTELQLYNIAKINESGGYATLVYPENLDVIMKELEAISDAKS